MQTTKRAKLARAGWRVGSVDEFLGLSAQESALIALKLALSAELRRRRIAKRLSQGDLARLLGSSQSRVAKMEAADPSVSMDLLVRAHFALGATPRDLARAFVRASRAA
jgi:hypothetical protein